MKQLEKRTWLTVLACSALLLGCNDASPLLTDAAATPTTNTSVASTSTPTVSAETLALKQALDALPLEPVSASELESVQFMREEEKLTHDVYVLAYSLWNQPVFDNIAASETSHTEAVKLLLDRYGIADPSTGVAGTFANQTLQAVYNTYAARVQASLIDALIVGAEIEDLDIRDLEVQKSQVDNQDILKVYDELLKGSRNHLRAYVQQLAKLGMSYTPQFISQAQFEEIIGTATETGRR